MELKNDEMYKISGGGISWSVIAGIGAGIVYLLGIISGYTNPNKCNNSK